MILALLLAQSGYLTPFANFQAANPLLNELSGVVLSRRVPGLLYAHNDSGDSARLFTLRLSDGATVGPASGYPLTGATAVDWEDMCSDGKNLFIADLGNNANMRRDLKIYTLADPNGASGPLATRTT